MRFKKSNNPLLAGAVLLGVWSGGFAPAMSAEGITPAGPIGGTDIRQALLPPPGNYGALVGGQVNLPGYVQNGTLLPADGQVWFGGAGFMHVYSDNFFGGTIASTIFSGGQSVCLNIHNIKPNSCSAGPMDIYSDVFVWNKFFPSADFATQPKTGGPPIPYGTAIMFGLGMNFPTGTYDPAVIPNVGSNFYTFSPNIAVTHNMKSIIGPWFGEATELSARVFFNAYTKNPATEYLTGPTLSVDFSATERNGPWQYGLAGVTFWQVAPDVVNGITVPGNGREAHNLSIGPIIAYDFMLGGHPFNIMAKCYFGIPGMQQNTTVANGPTIRLVTPLN
jgi:hypothetical protein